MAESIAVEVLQPVIEATVKSVGATIKRQFNYLCCFTSNIAALKDEVERLDDAAKGLQGRVDREIDNVQVIVPEVETWIKRSNHIKDEMNGILAEVPNVESGCFNLRARFSLSKRAKKTTDHMEELRGQCKFDAISQPGPPPATRTLLLGTTYEFESRKQIEEGIMKSLRDGEMNMIGICGMGGLGKTTMAKKIMNRALEKEHLFEEVVLAVVSQPIDKLKIQKDVGGSLGLNLEGETEQTRIQKLHARLSGTKKILLVLDDIWEGFEVEELGIPRDCKNCKILLTSRNHHVLRAMNVEKLFGMEVLTKEDAWFLFREIAGTCVDDAGLHSIVEQVVKECGGLPIALSTVGAALKDEMNKAIWKDVLRQLRKSNPSTIPEILKNVYKPLKVSYERLDSKEAKSVFLLCCLFGEDFNIPLDYLTYICLELGIFEGNMEEARNRMSALTKMLKSRSLLLDIDGQYSWPRIEIVGRYFVRMHDVVRDVCIFIAKEEAYIGGGDCTWFSSIHATLRERSKLPTNLRLLYLTGNSKMEEEINFDNSFVEGIRELRVLYIENYLPFTSLPHTTEPLRNLGTLVLDSCSKLETISSVGELVHLEILICRKCDSIKELPLEMKGLTRLKLLDLSGCQNLKRIDRDIISSLVGLEELKMLGSFDKWEAWDINEERENGNARLRELEALTNLRCLEIQIDDLALVAQNMRLSSKLERFQIQIPFTDAYSQHRFFSHSSNKKLSLKWEGENCLGDWVEQLLGDAECLYLSGNGANNVDYLAKSPNIRGLQLDNCETMKNIGRISMDDATVFPHMEFLRLESLPQLEEILDGPISSNSFENLNSLRLLNLPGLKQMWKSSSTSPVLPKLKEIVLQQLPNLATFELPLQGISFIEIAHCGRLRNLGQLLSAQNDYHSQLETLKIWNCEMVEQVFLWNDNEEEERRITKIMFPKLKEVLLYNLPKLVTLCEGIGSSRNADMDHNHCPRLFCQEKVSFDGLKRLTIQGMNAFYCQKVPVSIFNRLEVLTIFGNKGSMIVITLSMALNFVSLRRLCIENCDEIVEVIKDEEEAVSGGERTLLFPKLEELLLFDLCKLVSFCKGNCYVNCRRVSIINCSNVKIFNLGFHISFPFNGLEELIISGYAGSMSLFSPSIARNLVSLKQLIIYDCKEMVKVIEDEKEEENVVSSGAAQTTTTILFPKLQVLRLISLAKLESFCEWKSDIKMPSLKEVQITRCDDMKIFSFGTLSTPNLETVEINLKEVLESGEKDLNGALKQQYLIPMEKQKKAAACEEEEEEKQRKTITEEDVGITKGEIEEEQNLSVVIESCSNMKIFNLGSHVSFPFNGLEELRISTYKGSMSLFSSSIARNLVSLKQLAIYGSFEMVKVIEDEKEEENVVSSGAAQTTTTILFPKLQKLTIEGCSNMKIFKLGSHVSFPFNGLEELTIRRYEDSMSLFSSSIARNLVSLKQLDISFCGEMVKVIEDEKEEENVVSSGAAQTTTTILFPKLQKLELQYLWKLESFCQWKCDITMPSLKRVLINGCDDMKTFTLGPLTTPNLETVKINKEDFGGEKDLNGTLKQQYLIRMKARTKAGMHYYTQETKENNNRRR